VYLASEATNKEMQELRRCLQNVENEVPEKIERMQGTEENHEVIAAPAAKRRETVVAESPDVHFGRRFAWGDVPWFDDEEIEA
jgi:phosphoribosyl-ATP pyrophosphohydrolase